VKRSCRAKRETAPEAKREGSVFQPDDQKGESRVRKEGERSGEAQGRRESGVGQPRTRREVVIGGKTERIGETHID